MSDARPKLAVLWEEGAFSPLEVAEAAQGLCQPLFVVGWSEHPSPFPLRALRRLGAVVEVQANTPEAVLSALEPVDLGGVIVFTDPPQRLAAAVAQQRSLPFHSMPTSLALSDKVAQRAALAAAGLPVPAFRAVRRSVEVAAPALGHADKFPAVLKPRLGAASKDAFFVRSQAEMRAALEGSAQEDFVLEEFLIDCNPLVSRLGSDVVSVETMVVRGEPTHVGMCGRFEFLPPFRDTGGFSPSDLSPGHTAAIHEMATRACHALQLYSGAAHIELKLTPDGPRVIEVNGRLGGNVPGLLGRLGSPSLLSAAMRVALGLPWAPWPEPAMGTGQLVAFTRFVRAPLGASRVVSVTGLEQVRQLPGVSTVRLVLQPGDPICWEQGWTPDHVVAVEGTAAGHDALAWVVDQIDSLVEPTFDPAL